MRLFMLWQYQRFRQGSGTCISPRNPFPPFTYLSFLLFTRKPRTWCTAQWYTSKPVSLVHRKGIYICICSCNISHAQWHPWCQWIIPWMNPLSCLMVERTWMKGLCFCWTRCKCSRISRNVCGLGLSIPQTEAQWDDISMHPHKLVFNHWWWTLSTDRDVDSTMWSQWKWKKGAFYNSLGDNITCSSLNWDCRWQDDSTWLCFLYQQSQCIQDILCKQIHKLSCTQDCIQIGVDTRKLISNARCNLI